MNKIDFLKEALKEKGYIFKSYKDMHVEIGFEYCRVEIWETLEENLYFKIIDNNEKKIFSKTYKTINNVFKYGFKNII